MRATVLRVNASVGVVSPVTIAVTVINPHATPARIARPLNLRRLAVGDFKDKAVVRAAMANQITQANSGVNSNK